MTQDPLIEDILSKISFRFIPPEREIALWDSVDLTKREAYKSLDVANTTLWDKSTPLFDMEYLSTPRMSTIANGYIINRMVAEMPAGLAYLNIGVWCGFSFFSGILGNESKRCIGVDNFSEKNFSEKANIEHIFEEQYKKFKNENTRFHKMDYVEYFERVHAEPLGFYFYDADHSFENQRRALELAEPFMAAGSYVLVDDTNAEAPRKTTLEYAEATGYYDVVLDARTANNGHPTFWNGLLVLRKGT